MIIRYLYRYYAIKRVLDECRISKSAEYFDICFLTALKFLTS